jgi:hypothetical protein
MFAWWLLLLTIALLPRGAAAQRASEPLERVTPGTRVRLTAPSLSPRRIGGRMAGFTADTVFVIRAGTRVAVPTAAVTRAEVSQGRDHLRGMVAGGLAGGAAGGAVGVLVGLAGESDCQYCLSSRTFEGAARAMFVGAVLWAPAGAMFGLVRGAERWEVLGQTGALRVIPVSDGRVGITLAFSAR